MDTSDQLLADQEGAVSRDVVRTLISLSEHDRLILLELGATEPMVDICKPKLNNNRDRNRNRTHLEEPVYAAIGELEDRDDQPESPLIETMVYVAARDDWRDANGRVHVDLYTDGLQNSEFQSHYIPGTDRKLDKPILDGVTIRIVPLKNAEFVSRQREAFERLEAAFTNLEAEVEYAEPGWLTLSS